MSRMEKLAMMIILSIIAPFAFFSLMSDQFSESIESGSSQNTTVLETLGSAGVQSPIGQSHPWRQ